MSDYDYDCGACQDTGWTSHRDSDGIPERDPCHCARATAIGKRKTAQQPSLLDAIDRALARTPKPPTQAQRLALLQLRAQPSSSWNFGSTTVNVLRKNGWAVNADDKSRGTMLVITDAGRAALS